MNLTGLNVSDDEITDAAYELVHDDERFAGADIECDIEIMSFEKTYWGKIYETEFFAVPNPIVYQGECARLPYFDYPLPDNGWTVMSRKMLEVLQNVQQFECRVMPVRVDDDTISPMENRRPSFHDYVAVQMSEFPDVFDYENSVYERGGEIKKHQRLARVTEVAFHIPPVGLPPLFRLAEIPTRLFVSREARIALKNAKITGVAFVSRRGYSRQEIRYWRDTLIDLPRDYWQQK